MLQLIPPIPVTCPHGEGMALIVLDYGTAFNTIWLVALKDSLEIKHYESKDIRIQKNWTFGYGTQK